MVRPAYSDINDTLYFSHTSKEARALLQSDSDFERIFALISEVTVDIEGDGFIALARAIVDQQISIHAARAIWGRLLNACGGAVTADAIRVLEIGEMRAVGLSERKASYLHDLSAKVLSGDIDFESLVDLPDEDIIEKLVTVKGIGRWTAEMYLIFSLKRLDVFALDDGGLRRAVAAFKALPTDVPRVVIEDFASVWSPYRSVAALFLWRWVSEHNKKDNG